MFPCTLNTLNITVRHSFSHIILFNILYYWQHCMQRMLNYKSHKKVGQYSIVIVRNKLVTLFAVTSITNQNYLLATLGYVRLD